MPLWFHKSETPDPHSLLSSDILENSRGLGLLKEQFRKMLPKRFGEITTHPSPTTIVQNVLRANCTVEGCGMRAIIHYKRGDSHRLELVESEPIFDRARHSNCKDCQKL